MKSNKLTNNDRATLVKKRLKEISTQAGDIFNTVVENSQAKTISFPPVDSFECEDTPVDDLFLHGLNLLSILSRYPYLVRDFKVSQLERQIFLQFANFLGVVVGKSAVYSFLSDSEKKGVKYFLQNAGPIIALGLRRGEPVSNILSDKFFSHIDDLAISVFGQNPYQHFARDLQKAKTDHVYAAQCLLRIMIANYESLCNEDLREKSYEFCPNCIARSLVEQTVSHIEEILLPPIKGRKVAAAIESFARIPHLPYALEHHFLSWADIIRGFVDIDVPRDQLNNYDGVLHVVSQVYVCSRIEAIVLVNRGMLSAASVAQTYNMNEDEVNKIAESNAVKYFIKTMWIEPDTSKDDKS